MSNLRPRGGYHRACMSVSIEILTLVLRRARTRLGEKPRLRRRTRFFQCQCLPVRGYCLCLTRKLGTSSCHSIFIHHYLAKLNQRTGRKLPRISSLAMRLLSGKNQSPKRTRIAFAMLKMVAARIARTASCFMNVIKPTVSSAQNFAPIALLRN